MSAKRPGGSTALLWLTVVASPAALAIETALRRLLFPDDFELIREFLESSLSWVAWGFVLLAGLGSAAGLWLQRKLFERRAGGLSDEANTTARREQLAVGVFLLTSAIPQIPSIFATFCFTFGASLVPVLVSIALTSVGVLGQAWQVRRLAAWSGDPSEGRG